MPQRVAKSKFPRFDAVASTKLENGTYDMNDEDHTDHSCPNSSVPSETDSMGEIVLFEAVDATTPDTPISPVSGNKMYVASQSNTENSTNHSEENEDESVASLAFSENESAKNRAVSWSDSDGSTYISENNGDNNSLGSKEPAKNEPSHDVKDDEPKLHDPSNLSGEPFVDVELGDDKTGSGPPKSSIKTTKKPTPHESATTTKKVTIAACNKPSLRKWKPHNPLLLEHVDYYTDVDVASTNDGLSVVEFISKEETRAIFCRRLIPLEIPVQKRKVHDDVSAFSSEKAGSVMPTGDTLSVQAAYTRRGTGGPKRGEKKNDSKTQASKSRPLENVDYLTTIEVASNNLDVSTVTCRVSQQVAVSAFFKKRDDLTKEEEQSSIPQLVVEFPKHGRLDSLSTLGSKSATSDELDTSDCSLDESRNYATFRDERLRSFGDSNSDMQPLLDSKIQVEPTPRISNQKARLLLDGDFPEVTRLKNEPELSTDVRIRVLRERIRQMQAASELESLPEEDLHEAAPNPECSREAPKAKRVPPSKTEKSREKGDHNISTRFSSEEHSSKPVHVPTGAPDADLGKTLELQDLDIMETTPMLDNATAVFDTATSKSSERNGGVPSVVTPVLDELDDVSTIHCDFDHIHSRRTELIDVEFGSQHDKTEIDHPSKGNLVFRTKRNAVQYSRVVTQKIAALARQANTALREYAVYQRLHAYVVELWMNHMDGRSPTERAIIGVMILSFFVFFILLISIIS